MAVRVTGGLVLDLAGGCRGFGFVCGTGSRVFRIETGSAAADEESRASLSGRRRFGGEGIVRRRGNPTPVDNGHAVDGGLGTLLFVKTDPPGRRPGRLRSTGQDVARGGLSVSGSAGKSQSRRDRDGGRATRLEAAVGLRLAAGRSAGQLAWERAGHVRSMYCGGRTHVLRQGQGGNLYADPLHLLYKYCWPSTRVIGRLH